MKLGTIISYFLQPPFPAIPLISNDATSQVNSSSNNFLSYHYLHQRLSHKHTEGGPAMDRNDHLNDLSLSDNNHYNSLASHSVEDTARPVKSQPEEESVVFEKAKPRDKTYVEKRKKNNQSAKRSRDTKRQKDELTAMRVLCLEEEHRRLQAELLRLTAEVEEYRFALKSACYQ